MELDTMRFVENAAANAQLPAANDSGALDFKSSVDLSAATKSVQSLYDRGVQSQPESTIVWLVEWPEDDNMPVRWWNPRGGWMRNANKALWFVRKSDAEDYLEENPFLRRHKITEHKFVRRPE